VRVLVVAATRPEVEPLVSRLEAPVAHHRVLTGVLGAHKVDVAMTLTAPGCGMGPAIAADAKDKILLVPGVGDADVRITWEPPWNQSMISEEGKMKLGLI